MGTEDLDKTLFLNFYNFSLKFSTYKIFKKIAKEIEKYNDKNDTDFFYDYLEKYCGGYPYTCDYPRVDTDIIKDNINLKEQILSGKDYIEGCFSLFEEYDYTKEYASEEEAEGFIDDITIRIPTKFILTKDFNWKEDFEVKIDNIDTAEFLSDLIIKIDLPLGKKIIDCI